MANDRPEAERSTAPTVSVDRSVLASLEIRTSADIIEATEEEYGEDRRRMGYQWQIRKPRVAPLGRPIDETGNGGADVIPSVRLSTLPDPKRVGPGNASQPAPKRKRAMVRRERDEEEQMRNLASVLGTLEEEFAEKKQLSYG
ncbi:hypothetical protein GGS23DRAFT_600517 [Durotheca rogersii]|uniref:uncharacterized protein n=1 Tax=Durotheca rogersii TaxID=419775 RepID=UPI002220EDF4|nr:uncharacterized protein GGS23DRAFT_600517 [Durotheca rogersii]KAI5859395.1 hypothetical protein GGS23DRAFT_600517 [Durotheca rogersii]